MDDAGNTPAPARQRGAFGLVMRLVWALLAAGASMLLAVLILVLIGGYWMGDELIGDMSAEGDLGFVVNAMGMLMGGASFLTSTAPALTPYPALLLALVGEVAQIRNWIFYVVGGGLAMLAVPLLASQPGTAFDAKMMTVFATSGFAGGALYWLLAGRNA